MVRQNMARKAGAASDARLASEAETAEYIADLVRQLERLAEGAGLVRLQYLLMEAREEAARLGKI